MSTKTPYNPKTGLFSLPWDLSCEENYDLNRSEDQDFIDGAFNREKKYVDVSASPHEAKDRPTFEPLADKSSIAADGNDVLTITGLPEGATTFELLGPVTDTWTETRLMTDLTINMPGQYKIKIRQWPYQDREVEFDAS